MISPWRTEALDEDFCSSLARSDHWYHWVDLSVPAPLYHVDQTRYWFGLFSHRRATQQWKGMLELPLGSLAEDHEAANLLRSHDDPKD